MMIPKGSTNQRAFKNYTVFFIPDDDEINLDERSFWQNAKKKLPVLCRLYTKHELSIERLISLYLHVGLIKAHKTLKDYCTRKLATLERDDGEVENPKGNKFFGILNWINKKLQKWNDEKVEEISETPEEKNVIIYPQKLNLVIFPPSVEAANEAVEEPVDEPLTPEEFSQDLWDEISPTPSRRSLRMAQTDKPTFSEYLKNNLNFGAIFPKTTNPPKRREDPYKIMPFVPMPDVLKEEFEKFEKTHHITPLPVLEAKIVPKPEVSGTGDSFPQALHIPLLMLYLVPVVLILCVLFVLCYLVAYVKRKSENEPREGLLNVRIEQGSDEDDLASTPKELSRLLPKGESKTRKESYEDD